MDELVILKTSLKLLKIRIFLQFQVLYIFTRISEKQFFSPYHNLKSFSKFDLFCLFFLLFFKILNIYVITVLNVH